MRKSREETARTREHIVRVASAEFRRRGIAATSLADLMGAAGLTHGGFYKHFESKDQLVAECSRLAMGELLEMLDGLPGTEERIERYLSELHRDHPEQGCPLSALGSEAARADEVTRGNLSAGVARLIELLSVSGDRSRAVASAAALVGALTLSRLVTDAELSAELLRESRRFLEKA